VTCLTGNWSVGLYVDCKTQCRRLYTRAKIEEHNADSALTFAGEAGRIRGREVKSEAAADRDRTE